MSRPQRLQEKLKELEKNILETRDFSKLKEMFEEYYLTQQELEWYELDMINKYDEREVI